MPQNTTTLTLRLDLSLKADLDRLAGQTHRTKSFLAAHAIKDYVASELLIIDGIKKSQEDYRAGRTASHDEVMSSLAARFNFG